MKYQLSTAKSVYKAALKDEKDQMERLEKLGFTFDPYTGSNFNGRPKFHIEGSPTIEITTLEELMIFQKEWGVIIIYRWDEDFHGDLKEGAPELRLEIYNGYRE